MTDETTAKKDEATAQSREPFRAPNYAEHYANSCLAEISQWDIQVTFGRNDDAQGVARDQRFVKIFMSPMHAKAVSRILAQMVTAYEEKFGEIKTQAVPATLDTDAKR